jgi:hypothetical protein
VLRFRVLDLAVTVGAADAGIVAALGILVQRAEHEGPVQAAMTCSVERHNDGFAARVEGEEIARRASLDEVVNELSLVVYDRAMALADPPGGVVALHALHRGSRILGFADQSVRVPLAIALATSGMAVQGAGLTLLDDGLARAVAEPFLFMDDGGTLAASLPGVVPHVAVGGSVMRAFHPDVALIGWRVDAGPVDLVCDLQLGASRVRITETPHWEMARIAGRYTLARRPADLAGELARLASRARCVRLELPTADDAKDALDRVLR